MKHSFELKGVDWHSGFDNESQIPGAVTLVIGYKDSEYEDYFDALHVGPNAASKLLDDREAFFGYGCFFTGQVNRSEVELLLSKLIESLDCEGDWERDVLKLGALGRWEDDPRADEYHEDERWPKPSWDGYLGSVHRLEVRKLNWIQSAINPDLQTIHASIGIAGEKQLFDAMIRVINVREIESMSQSEKLVLGKGLLLCNDQTFDIYKFIESEINKATAESDSSKTLIKISRFGNICRKNSQ